ncbi:hypothetical protein AMECASPLE_038670 [Ameca splendens]|uniref:Uncharacterized protein n=1 Tax=Ameca splendens TaxID=208324 RepID=A0ABV0XXQ6_9TELE
MTLDPPQVRGYKVIYEQTICSSCDITLKEWVLTSKRLILAFPASSSNTDVLKKERKPKGHTLWNTLEHLIQEFPLQLLSSDYKVITIKRKLLQNHHPSQLTDNPKPF